MTYRHYFYNKTNTKRQNTKNKYVISLNITIATSYVCFQSWINRFLILFLYIIFLYSPSNFRINSNYIQYNTGSQFFITLKETTLQTIYCLMNTFFQINKSLIVWVSNNSLTAVLHCDPTPTFYFFNILNTFYIL